MRAAALLALLLLAYASVQSIVMQAAMASPLSVAPMCGGMAMTTSADAPPARAPNDHARKGGDAHPASCPYCAAAAHAPLAPAPPAPPNAPSAFTFAAFRSIASHGPRGPPSCRPRAREPPNDPATT